MSLCQAGDLWHKACCAAMMAVCCYVSHSSCFVRGPAMARVARLEAEETYHLGFFWEFLRGRGGHVSTAHISMPDDPWSSLLLWLSCLQAGANFGTRLYSSLSAAITGVFLATFHMWSIGVPWLLASSLLCDENCVGAALISLLVSGEFRSPNKQVNGDCPSISTAPWRTPRPDPEPSNRLSQSEFWVLLHSPPRSCRYTPNQSLGARCHGGW